MTKLKVSFDIGGVLTKYPHIFRPIIDAFLKSDAVEVYVLTDMHEHSKAVKFVQGNGFNIPAERILTARYSENGEECKAEMIKEHGINLHVDDYPGYCDHRECVSLFVWPNATEPYYHDTFQTDGSEGDFGRRRRPHQ